ncbi:helix-turn-helix domain-containing protein [Hominifimenecus sp. rT4P-3]|uniref:helix-turn-helix domain-containing protein n=1 Tax=Hominifimenecus sp. rT4P-3 TaxID=3242979 RepID=UPI003DA28242
MKDLLYNNVVDICEKRGITLCRLEKELGFGNGSVRKWKECEPGIQRVMKVAKYLGVSVGRLLEDEIA